MREGETLLDEAGASLACRDCGRPLLVGEARYTAGEPDVYRHYACYQAGRAALDEAGEKFESTLFKINSLLKVVRRSLR